MNQKTIETEQEALKLMEGKALSEAVQKNAIDLVREGFTAERAIEKAQENEAEEKDIRWRMAAGLTRAQAASVVRDQRAENVAEAERQAAKNAKRKKL